MDTIKNITPNILDNVSKVFYICSYTGCGTMMLKNAIEKQGYYAKIIHDRNPPKELEFAGSDFGYETSNYIQRLKFNGIKVPEEYLHKFYVIYIYKNPINSIYSRLYLHSFSDIITNDTYYNPDESKSYLESVLNQEKDLYGLEDFFDNYTKKNQDRNYKIICVNYHELLSPMWVIETLRS